MTIPVEIENIAILGWRVAPTNRDRSGKFKGYVDAATCDLDIIERWAREYSPCNWTVIPDRSGVFALDIDIPGATHSDDGVAAIRRLIDRHGPLPERPHGRSGSGGHLMVFRDTGHPIRCKSSNPAPGIDPRAGRNGFTVAPSIHRHGNPYRWVIAPWELTPPPAPAWLLTLLAPPPEPPAMPYVPTTEKAQVRLRKAIEAVQNIGNGSRNVTLNAQTFAVARHVASGKLAEADAIHALYSAARAAGLDHAEAKATIRSGFVSGLRAGAYDR